jgi:membrane protein DedA with SNARE-associated domain
MGVATLVHNHGYAAVFAGSFLEGETVAALRGLAANRGYLALPWVIAIAAAGGFLSDQVFSGVGRRGGVRMVARFYAQKLMQVQRQQGLRLGLGGILPNVTKGVTQ